MSNPHSAEVEKSECQHDWRLNPWWEVWASDQYDCQKCKEVRYVHFTEDPDKVLGVES